ncbi:unnamed protein product [Acanthoscelides obtectus]|uniref:Uncharacterized protein n=1 Tax=Acanthoscelides obtectus TaxID=200917 RepID=A0A9P0PYC6_ACAOB|nr:unnamed protein product [Acanthoscelides obtectus]CAH2009735.1 unnamed protein product [Acanthoscelides obtectus]CAK1678385.1 hypothetical protein AOBTE_LOCUS31856 [Acanthoscelides obtectus]CAK1678388.1 hypothetical protein AOBTE_LOCUS31858 [Acanthoscelides obtectus]
MLFVKIFSCSDKLARELDVRSTHLQVFTLVEFYETAVEEAGQELYNYRKGALDAVYIPPDVDNVTDEEDVEDELLPEIDVPGPSDIAGTLI